MGFLVKSPTPKKGRPYPNMVAGLPRLPTLQGRSFRGGGLAVDPRVARLPRGRRAAPSVGDRALASAFHSSPTCGRSAGRAGRAGARRRVAGRAGARSRAAQGHEAGGVGCSRRKPSQGSRGRAAMGGVCTEVGLWDILCYFPLLGLRGSYSGIIF